MPFAHSMFAALRHPGFACKQRRLYGTGNPSRMLPGNEEMRDGSDFLARVGEPIEPPPVSPARGPPTEWKKLMQGHFRP